MNVTIETNFDIWGDRNIVEVNPKDTLRMLLEKLSEKFRFPIMDPLSGEIDIFMTVSVNNKEYFTLPQQLDTQLNDGDKVEITVTVAAGG